MRKTRKDFYEHTLVETCCDYCGKKTETPLFFKFEETWHLWFFCKKEHQHAFGHRGHEGYITLQ